jgi:phenylacetate-CoA ligase
MWAPEWEAMERERLEKYQGQRLREQVSHVYQNADFFRQLYDDAGIIPSDIQGLEDLKRLPTFDKDDLREYRNETGDFWCGTQCVPESQIKRTMHSTGTTGKPNFFGLTENDEEAVADYGAAYLYAMGLRNGDRMSKVGTTSGWHGMVNATDLGARKIGVNPVRSAYGPQNIAESMFTQHQEADFNAIPVFQPEFEKQYIEENDIDPTEEFPNLRFTFSGVDASDPKYELFEEVWGVPFKNSYCSGDQFLLTYPCEAEQKYFHVPEKYFLIEVLDADTREPVEPGERGEIFITNLWSEANPYIRYRLEDLVDLKVEECECGRTTKKIKPAGRLSWSVNVDGRDKLITNIEVEGVLWGHDELYGENYQLVETDPEQQDELIVRIATDNDVSDELLSQVTTELETELNVSATCRVIGSDDIEKESFTKLERVAEEY